MHSKSFIVLATVGLGLVGIAAIAQAQNQRGGMTAERLMQFDADKNGSLTRDELPARLAKRVFDEIDSDGDGTATAAEVNAFVEGQNKTADRDHASASDETNAEAAKDDAAIFSESMGDLNRILRALFSSPYDATSIDTDLETIDELQDALVRAKQSCAGVPMAGAAVREFENDHKAYALAFRKALHKTLAESVELEAAVLEGDTDKAKSHVQALLQFRNKGHELFQG